MVFVGGTAPGDLVEAAVRDRGRLLEGRLLRVVEAGPARVPTRCVHVDVCGGCQWQQVSIEAQREAKRSNLIEALVRIARVPRESLGSVGLVASPESFRYRRRARFMVDDAGRLGYAGSQGRGPVALRECHLLTQPIERLALGLSSLLRESSTRPHHVEICAVGEEASVLLEYDSGSPEDLQADLVKLMFAELPSLAGVVVTPRSPKDVELGNPTLSDGKTYLRPDAFSQANQAVNEKLVQAVLGALEPKPSDRVLELFCGSGNFTLPLARLAREVVAVERLGMSLALLKRAALEAGISNLRIRPGEAAEIVRALAQSDERVDLALLDPPRAGARDLLGDLVRLAPRRIAYVSCDPATLARDVGVLLGQGYRLEEATVFDQFPQTYHLEALALLGRSG